MNVHSDWHYEQTPYMSAYLTHDELDIHRYFCSDFACCNFRFADIHSLYDHFDKVHPGNGFQQPPSILNREDHACLHQTFDASNAPPPLSPASSVSSPSPSTCSSSSETAPTTVVATSNTTYLPQQNLRVVTSVGAPSMYCDPAQLPISASQSSSLEAIGYTQWRQYIGKQPLSPAEILQNYPSSYPQLYKPQSVPVAQQAPQIYGNNSYPNHSSAPYPYPHQNPQSAPMPTMHMPTPLRVVSPASSLTSLTSGASEPFFSNDHGNQAPSPSSSPSLESKSTAPTQKVPGAQPCRQRPIGQSAPECLLGRAANATLVQDLAAVVSNLSRQNEPHIHEKVDVESGPDQPRKIHVPSPVPQPLASPLVLREPENHPDPETKRKLRHRARTAEAQAHDDTIVDIVEHDETGDADYVEDTHGEWRPKKKQKKTSSSLCDRASPKTPKARKVHAIEASDPTSLPHSPASPVFELGPSVRKRIIARSTSSGTNTEEKREGPIIKCSEPGCIKVYRNNNGLRYHLQKGTCEINPDKYALDIMERGPGGGLNVVGGSEERKE